MSGHSIRTDESPRARSARNRRASHEARVDSASGWRQKLWRLYGWLLVEVRHLPEDARRPVVDRLADLVSELNERNRSS